MDAKNGKKAGAPATKGAGTPATALMSLDRRVEALEGHVAVLQGVAAPAGDSKPLTFKLEAGGPRLARLTLLDTHEMITLGSDAERSKLRANGIELKLILEVWGDPGQQAIIDAVNAVPTPMTSGVLQTGYLIEKQTLRTQW